MNNKTPTEVAEASEVGSGNSKPPVSTPVTSILVPGGPTPGTQPATAQSSPSTEHHDYPSPPAVEFTIANGQVTGMARVVGSKTLDVKIPATASFTVGSGGVTETLSLDKGTELIQFVQDSSTSLTYHVASELFTVTTPTTTGADGATQGVSFTLANGAVTGMQAVHGTDTHNLRLSPTTSFAVGTDSVTETMVFGNVIVTKAFVSSGGTGVYALASYGTSFIPAGSSATRLWVAPEQRAQFTFDASGSVSQVAQVRADGRVGSLHAVSPTSHTTFTLLAPGYVEAISTEGKRSSYQVFHDGNADGIYTAVAHGSGSTVDLIGLQAQVSATIDAVT